MLPVLPLVLLAISGIAHLKQYGGRLPFLQREHTLAVNLSCRHVLHLAMDDCGRSGHGEHQGDDILIESVSKEELGRLCTQFSISTDGTKEDLLQRLREYANNEMSRERERLEQRRRRVENGGDDTRERFEIIESCEEEKEEDEVFFYYPTDDILNRATTMTNRTLAVNTPRGDGTSQSPSVGNSDKNIGRVVTVYSTTDNNDLTGVFAAQPGQSESMGPLADDVTSPINTPWGKNDPTKMTAANKYLVEAKEEIFELVEGILNDAGIPGFETDNTRRHRSHSSEKAKISSVGSFDPARVSIQLLNEKSQSLRAGRGRALDEALREIELRAVGYDGPAGDDMEQGGGHYREVSKVRSFLEGYRRAEERRFARNTATMLLDTLVSEGLEALDVLLVSMVNSQDDTNRELYNSLLDYLNDAIRQQEKRVVIVDDSLNSDGSDDLDMENLWSVEVVNGETIQTFDPNLPSNRRVLEEECKNQPQTVMPATPKSASEKILFLLKLLRDRLKTEATFSHDEKARNLRVLAYCLKLHSSDHRRELIAKEFGTSLDRLDSFSELVASSIEYGESTSHQLQPSNRVTLDLQALREISKATKEIRDYNLNM